MHEQKRDANDPRTWFRLLVDAVAGLHADNVQPAQIYLRFVEAHRGRPEAEKAKAQLGQYRRAESWRHAAHWQANDYVIKDPPRAKERRWR